MRHYPPILIQRLTVIQSTWPYPHFRNRNRWQWHLMLCHCPAGLAEWLTRHWSPLFFLATKTHDLRRRNSAHPPPPTAAAGDLPLHHQGQRSCLPRCLFSLLFFLEVAAPSSPSLQPASPPRLPRGCGTLLFFLATSAPSSSSSRPRPPIHLPRGRGPLLFFLLATATSLRAGSCPSGCSTGRLCPL